MITARFSVVSVLENERPHAGGDRRICLARRPNSQSGEDRRQGGKEKEECGSFDCVQSNVRAFGMAGD